MCLYEMADTEKEGFGIVLPCGMGTKHEVVTSYF